MNRAPKVDITADANIADSDPAGSNTAAARSLVILVFVPSYPDRDSERSLSDHGIVVFPLARSRSRFLAQLQSDMGSTASGVSGVVGIRFPTRVKVCRVSPFRPDFVISGRFVALVGRIWSDLASSGRIWWRFRWVSLSISPDAKSISLQNTAHLSSDPERHLVVDRPVYPGHGRIRGEHAFGMTTPVRHARERGYVGAGDQRIPEVRGFGHYGWGRIGSKSQMYLSIGRDAEIMGFRGRILGLTAIVPSLVSGFVHQKIYFAFSLQD